MAKVRSEPMERALRGVRLLARTHAAQVLAVARNWRAERIADIKARPGSERSPPVTRTVGLSCSHAAGDSWGHRCASAALLRVKQVDHLQETTRGQCWVARPHGLTLCAVVGGDAAGRGRHRLSGADDAAGGGVAHRDTACQLVTSTRTAGGGDGVSHGRDPVSELEEGLCQALSGAHLGHRSQGLLAGMEGNGHSTFWQCSGASEGLLACELCTKAVGVTPAALLKHGLAARPASRTSTARRSMNFAEQGVPATAAAADDASSHQTPTISSHAERHGLRLRGLVKGVRVRIDNPDFSPQSACMWHR